MLRTNAAFGSDSFIRGCLNAGWVAIVNGEGSAWVAVERESRLSNADSSLDGVGRRKRVAGKTRDGFRKVRTEPGGWMVLSWLVVFVTFRP